MGQIALLIQIKKKKEKENIFKVEHFDIDFLKSNVNNSSINLYCSKRRKKEKIKKENKIDIRKETLDKIISSLL